MVKQLRRNRSDRVIPCRAIKNSDKWTSIGIQTLKLEFQINYRPYCCNTINYTQNTVNKRFLFIFIEVTGKSARNKKILDKLCK